MVGSDVSPWSGARPAWEDVGAVFSAERAHAGKCAASEAERLLPYLCLNWGLEVESFEGAASPACQFRALRRGLCLLGRGSEAAHAAALVDDASLRAALVAWLRGNGGRKAPGARAALQESLEAGEASWGAVLATLGSEDAFGDHRTLFAAAARFDVRVVVLSSAWPEPLVYDARPGVADADELVLGHYHDRRYVSLRDAPPAALPPKDIYARFVTEKASFDRKRLLDPVATAPPAIERVALVPDEERHCSGAIKPDMYVTSETARCMVGASGPDLGGYVGNFEDRIPEVQYLTTADALYKYGCYTLPAADAPLAPAPP